MNQIRKRHGRMQGSQNVHVIFDAIDSVKMALFVFQKSPDVSEQILTRTHIQNRSSILSRKYEMIKSLAVGGPWQRNYSSYGPINNFLASCMEPEGFNLNSRRFGRTYGKRPVQTSDPVRGRTFIQGLPFLRMLRLSRSHRFAKRVLRD